jgi:hypothetical protein
MFPSYFSGVMIMGTNKNDEILKKISSGELFRNDAIIGGLTPVVMKFIKEEEDSDEIEYDSFVLETSYGKKIHPLPEGSDGEYSIYHEGNGAYSHLKSVEDLVALLGDEHNFED